jgi:nicotinamidase-related amidase
MTLKTQYKEIVDIAKIASPDNTNRFTEVVKLAEQETLTPAVNDGQTTLLLIIDEQNDFMPGIGSLGVPGADADIARLTRWMYDNLASITQVMCSLDTHYPAQIFHPLWWINDAGQHPDPFTVITTDDVANGLWKPVYGAPGKSITYVQELGKLGRQPLCIWPYHCIDGGTGHNLEAEFANMVYFHAAARASQPALVKKGTDPYTEMYGIIRPEYNPNNWLNMPVLNAIEKFDRVVIAGEAASHCVAESCRQILEYFQGRLEVIQKIFILKDCTSPVVGFEQQATDALDEFARQGVQLVNSTEFTL